MYLGGPLKHKDMSCLVSHKNMRHAAWHFIQWTDLQIAQNKHHNMKKKPIVKSSTHFQSHRYSLSIELVVTVFAVHGYGCSNDGQEYNDPDDGSYDAACGGTLLWKTSTCEKRENTIRSDSQFSQEALLKSF